ncbi:Putative LOC100487802 (Silurana) [Caligus rogercresseyi]|uniref:LOC100487802 (Silurana) n=1 Tax=Caligus rogercresseyi TaxID=217165 RepID=A0A7T8GXS4_CALRO|nr:Putative LOC100487802 (Silurana) [Caligus rogercresseyi]
MSDLCDDIRSRYDLLSCESVTKKDGSVFILIRSSIVEQSNYLPHLNAVIDSGVVKLLSYHGRILQEEDAKESQILKQLNEGKLFLCLGIQEVSSLIGLSNNIIKSPSIISDLDDSALKDVYSEPSSDGSILYRSRGCSFYMENSLGPCNSCQSFIHSIEGTEGHSFKLDWDSYESNDEESLDNYEDWEATSEAEEVLEGLKPLTHSVKPKKTKDEGPIFCKICLRKFTRQSSLTVHYNIHAKIMNLEESIECPICQDSLRNRRFLNDHIRDVHDVSLSSCSICWEIFPRPELPLHHRLCSRDRICPFCGLKFRFPFELKYHVAGNHDVGGKESVLCELCGKAVPHKQALTKHIRRSHKKSYAFPCHQCPKAFSLNYQLKKHLRIHTKEKPFKCVFCAYCSARKDNVRTHQRRVHKKEPQRRM